MPPLFIIAVAVVVVLFAFFKIRGKKAAAVALEEGKAFLAENQNKEGIKTTGSGLQYQVLQAGEGQAHPGPKSQVTVHYHGTLLDGTVFDLSLIHI